MASRSLVQARWEVRLVLRNGEQLLLTFVIPLLLLPALVLLASQDVQSAVPSIMAASLLATCFTSLAIGTAFERRSGALRFLATTPLTRGELVAGKACATGVVATLSLVAVASLGAAMGWRPVWQQAPIVVASLVVGAFACSVWGVFLAGALRAEAVLAVANAVFLVLVIFGGVAIPAEQMPAPFGTVVSFLLSGALAEGLRGESWTCPIILLAWSASGLVLARRTFSWD